MKLSPYEKFLLWMLGAIIAAAGVYILAEAFPKSP